MIVLSVEEQIIFFEFRDSIEMIRSGGYIFFLFSKGGGGVQNVL